MDEHFLERFVLAMKSTGLSQRQFASRSGISPGYLTDIIKGRTTPSERVVREICAKHKFSEQWLVAGTGEMMAAKAGEGADQPHYIEEEQTDWCKPGEAVSDFEVRVIGMLRQVRPEARQALLNRITTAYFLEMEDRETTGKD